MIVLDTSFLVGLANPSDAHHEAATGAQARVLAGEWGEALVPEYVVLETVTVLMARAGIDLARAAGENLLASEELTLVPCSDHFVDAWEVFERQRAPRLSFADAAIVAIAKARGAGHVATFDDDFRDVDGLAVVPE